MTRFKWGKAMKMLIAALMVCLLSVLSFAVYNTYDAYTQMMIAQQQQHLLITARAASQNLSLYLSEQIRNVEILTQTPGFLNQFHTYYVSGEQKGLKEHILSYMLSQNQGISRIYLLDQNGNEVFRYNQYPFLEAFDESVLHLDRLVEDRQTGLRIPNQPTALWTHSGQQHYGRKRLSGGCRLRVRYGGSLPAVYGPAPAAGNGGSHCQK